MAKTDGWNKVTLGQNLVSMTGTCSTTDIFVYKTLH